MREEVVVRAHMKRLILLLLFAPATWSQPKPHTQAMLLLSHSAAQTWKSCDRSEPALTPVVSYACEPSTNTKSARYGRKSKVAESPYSCVTRPSYGVPESRAPDFGLFTN